MGYGSHRWELVQTEWKAPDAAVRAVVDEGLEAQVLADPSEVEIGLRPDGESSGAGVYLDSEGRQAVVTVAGRTVDDAALIEAMWAAARADADREDGPGATATRAIVVGRSVDPSLTPMTQWLSKAGVPVTVRVLEPTASRPGAVDDVEEEADRSLLPLGGLYPWLRKVPDVVLADEIDLREVVVPARVLSALRYGGHVTCGDLAEATLRDIEARYNMEMEKYNTIIMRLQEELTQIRADIQQNTREYEVLLNIKVKLEAEIAEYRRLLDGGGELQ